jgi:hypothetical protein
VEIFFKSAFPRSFSQQLILDARAAWGVEQIAITDQTVAISTKIREKIRYLHKIMTKCN